jgi:hypothetical protein
MKIGSCYRQLRERGYTRVTDACSWEEEEEEEEEEDEESCVDDSSGRRTLDCLIDDRDHHVRHS